MVINENKKAIIWSGIEKLGTYVVNFAIQIILARLLCPNDYAVVAMLAIFFSISQAFIDSGFHTTLIQKKDCKQIDYSSVFFFNIFVGGIVYILFFIGAPYIESFYGFEGLSIVTKIYSLNLFINSVTMVNRVILIKKLQFKKLAIITFVSSILSAIPAIFMAYYGWGYWALITQSLINSLFSGLLIIYNSKWHPSLVFSKSSLANLAPFGLKMLVVYIVHAIYNNIYSLLIGKNFSAQELGYYDRGKTLSSMGPVGFSDFYTRALYPIQAKVQDDMNKLHNSYNKSFTIMSLFVSPIAAFMFFFSEEVVFSLFGKQWMNSAFILQILCIGYMFYPLQALNMNMLKVKGKGDYMLISEILKKTMGIICIAIFIHYNLKWVVIGWTCCSIAEFLISEFFFLKLYHFSPFKSLKILLPIIITTFLSSFVLSIIIDYFIENYIIRFILGGFCFIFIYLLINFKRIKNVI